MPGWTQQQSPFEFQGPVSPDQVIGRDDEVASLRSYARSGRAVVVSAPRRYGKTSLLGRAVQLVRDADGAPSVLVDLYGVQTVADVAVRIERAYSRHLVGAVRRRVGALFEGLGMGLSLGPGGIAVSLSRNARVDATPILHTLLDLPRQVGSEQQRAWVVFDEFQELLAVPGAEGLLRSHVQHHRAVAGYAFAGSERTLLERMFADRERPFFDQAEPQRLGPLPRSPTAAFIRDAFARTDRSPGEALGRLMDTGDGHPQRTMLLAHHLWAATAVGETADAATWPIALRAALSTTRTASETRWERLSRNQQRVLRALVEFDSAYGREASAGAGLATGSVASTLAQLVDIGDLERTDNGRYRFIDPLFAAWIEREITIRGRSAGGA